MMSIYTDINQMIQDNGLTIYPGYPATGASLPYTVARPLIVTPDSEAIAGNATVWDTQYSLYACSGSVEASLNLAVVLMTLLQGARIGGTTLSTSMGYAGAQVEGHYESQVTVQLNQGAL